MKTSEINKIKKDILAASDVAKCRICRKVIMALNAFSRHYYTDNQVNHFLDLYQMMDFQAATDYYVNTMLASLKKNEPILYQAELVSRSSDLVMVHDIQPNGKDIIDLAQSDNNTAKTRITLDDIKHLMSEMDQRHADLLHYLFMCNYIDYSDYQFRDEWMIDAYVTIYNAYYHEDSNYLSAVNGYVIEILREWQHDANHKYQKAKHDLYYWLTDPIPEFNSSMGDEIESAWLQVKDSDDERVVARALMQFPMRISKLIDSGHYEDAAANVYCILEHLAITNKSHEDWFECMWNGGEQTMIADLVEVIQELYCHLRQKSDVPRSLKNEMDIHLEIFNKKTWFFGIDCGDSRYEDMLSDGKKQNGEYSDLSNCYMWKEWYLPQLQEN